MTGTARLAAEDIERARVIGAVQQRSVQEVFHAALAEYVASHRDELQGLFASVRDAVLSDDRDALRGAFEAQALLQAAEYDRRAKEIWSADEV